MLPKIIAYESCPKDAIYLIPPVTVTRYVFAATGEVREFVTWNAKQGGVIMNIGDRDE